MGGRILNPHLKFLSPPWGTVLGHHTIAPKSKDLSSNVSKTLVSKNICLLGPICGRYVGVVFVFFCSDHLLRHFLDRFPLSKEPLFWGLIFGDFLGHTFGAFLGHRFGPPRFTFGQFLGPRLGRSLGHPPLSPEPFPPPAPAPVRSCVALPIFRQKILIALYP